MIWWLAFEKKPFQFWQEILIQVVVILLQLYFTFGVWSMDSNFDYYPRKDTGFKGTQKLKILQYSLSELEQENTFMLIAIIYSFLLFNLGKFWGTLKNSVPCTASSLNCRTQKLQGSSYKKAATRNERLLKPLCAETWNWNCLFSSLYFDTTHILLS